MTTLVDAPTRVDGVELIGDMVGSGYRNPPALVRRGDGQVLQLTPLVYLVLNAADGRRGCAEIAELITRGLGRSVTESDVRTLVDSHLRPLGLLKLADGSEIELQRSNPLLGLKPRVAITNPRTTRRVTDPFRVLFRPVVAVAVVAGFVAVTTWVFFDRGLGASAYDAFERPHLLLLVFAVSVLSGGFHEFGHAAAARFSGGQPGAMGAGLYLVWPAFYTDVTDSYRLDRAGRIRTDLGGLYFNAIVVVLTFVWWWATGWEALLLLVATQVMQMVQQVQPLLRFDGYHVLADLAGVPDLYHRIKPTLLGLLPHRWKAPENKVLTPWARTVITLWVLVTVPMMALMLFALIRAVPRLLGTGGSVLQKDAAALADASRAGDLLDMAAQTVQMLGVVLPLMAGALVLGRIGFRFFGGLARWSQGSAPKRAAATLLTFAVITGLSWAWWPDPFTYRPIQPGERGLVTRILQVQETAKTDSAAGVAAHKRLSTGQPLVAAFPESQALPTKDDPVLALVLVPTEGEPDDTWVFPFDKPLPPAEGDNQALAVATTDGSMSYDLAFAMVWAEGDEVLNVNEAHAYASCSDCVAVAVAFQVVLIMDDAHVVVPQNLAVAANYDCYQCITAAIASQLVLSVEGEPGEEELRALGEVWGRLIEFAGRITSYTLTEITAKLDAIKAEIVGILGQAPAVEPAQSSVTTGPTSPPLAPSTTDPPPQTEQPATDPPPQTEQPATDPPPQTEESTTGSFSTSAESTPPSLTSEDSPSPPAGPSP